VCIASEKNKGKAMANQVILNPGRALDLNGYVVPGAKATFYLAGTDTLTSIFADIGEAIPAANPAIADANGVFPQRYATVSVKVVITSASDETLYTLDPAPVVQSTGAGASQISFAPTVPLPFTNVQAAIEGAAAASAAGFAAFGVGITGNAALLANLDATNIGAGVYRFDGTTTGTFPSGVLAADTGLIETWRQASGVAMMELGHGASDRVFRRRLAAGVWDAWREEIIVNQGAVAGDIIRRGASSWERLAVGANGTVFAVVSGAPAYASLILGSGQSWQNVLGSRVVATSYQNTTGRSIMVAISAQVNTSLIQVSTDNATWITLGRGAENANDRDTTSFVVPDTHYYRVTTGGTVTYWAELR
jgi:hypothetical protein